MFRNIEDIEGVSRTIHPTASFLMVQWYTAIVTIPSTLSNHGDRDKHHPISSQVALQSEDPCNLQVVSASTWQICSGNPGCLGDFRSGATGCEHELAPSKTSLCYHHKVYKDFETILMKLTFRSFEIWLTIAVLFVGGWAKGLRMQSEMRKSKHQDFPANLDLIGRLFVSHSMDLYGLVCVAEVGCVHVNIKNWIHILQQRHCTGSCQCETRDCWFPSSVAVMIQVLLRINLMPCDCGALLPFNC